VPTARVALANVCFSPVSAKCGIEYMRGSILGELVRTVRYPSRAPSTLPWMRWHAMDSRMTRSITVTTKKLYHQPGLQETARHEAGHAVAYWSHGWHFRYVTMRPRAENALAGVRIYRERVCDTPAKLVTGMECAAAGRIAQFHMSGDAASDQLLRMEFTRIAGPPFLETYDDVDMRQFVGCALALDWHGVRPTGPDGWLEIWHNAESKISGELWPAVIAVAAELTISPRRLSYEDVSAIVSAALPPLSLSLKPAEGAAPKFSNRTGPR
jgi:hypothetical protein